MNNIKNKCNSLQFVVDVPELWGIGADGSVMEVFNKLEKIKGCS